MSAFPLDLIYTNVQKFEFGMISFVFEKAFTHIKVTFRQICVLSEFQSKYFLI